jgi:hypothetical protein
MALLSCTAWTASARGRCGILCGLFLAALSGCVSMGSYQRAETLGKGGLETALEPAYLRVPGSDDGHVTGNAALRAGVAERVDVGLRAGSTGVTATTKVMLTAPDGDGLIVAVAPAAGGNTVAAEGDRETSINARLPVLLGLPLGRHELVLVPTLGFDHGTYHDESEALDLRISALGVGGALGFVTQLRPDIALVPELSLYTPLKAWGDFQAGGASAEVIDDGGFAWQAGLGVILGGPKAKPTGK